MKRATSRRDAIVRMAAPLAGIGILAAPAKAAQFVYKYANAQSLDNPVNVRALEMAANIRRDTGGRLEIQVFPASSLGTDTSMAAQVRVGAIQMSTQGAAILSPLAAIESIPFAFKTTAAAFTAQDGALGAAIRKEVETKDPTIRVFPYELDAGFNEIANNVRPIRTPDDLVGLKMRTPAASLYVDMMKELGAAVTPISVGEAYTALQTHLVDGLISPLVIIETLKFYEVQKYLTLAHLFWVGQWFYINADAWRALPPDIQTIFDRNARQYAYDQRRDAATLTNALRSKLASQGLQVNEPSPDTFKAKLSSFYGKEKQQFGATLWDALEKYAGKLGI